MDRLPTREELNDDPNIRDEVPIRVVPVKQPRITIVSSVYHQIPGDKTSGPPQSKYYRWLESDEQPYSRTVKVGIEWEPIDTGWLKDKEHSLLVITNSLKRLPSRKPTPEEEAEFYSHVLEIGWIEQDNSVTPIGYIPVGEDIRISPLNMHRYRIRSQTPDGKYSIFLVPM